MVRRSRNDHGKKNSKNGHAVLVTEIYPTPHPTHPPASTHPLTSPGVGEVFWV